MTLVNLLKASLVFTALPLRCLDGSRAFVLHIEGVTLLVLALGYIFIKQSVIFLLMRLPLGPSVGL